MDPDFKDVQHAYERMLQQATARFETEVTAATQAMKMMIQEAKEQQERLAPPPPPEPVAEQRDGGLWMNMVAVEMLLQALDKIAAIIQDIDPEASS